MGNYFGGELYLYLDAKKISIRKLKEIMDKHPNERLIYDFSIELNDEELAKGNHTIDEVYNDIYHKEIRVALGPSDEEEEISPTEVYLSNKGFHYDIIDTYIHLDYQDYYDKEPDEHKYVNESFLQHMENKVDNNLILCYKVKIECNTKYYTDYKCEETILGIIDDLREYKCTEPAKYYKEIFDVDITTNIIGVISDEDCTYYKTFVWDQEKLDAVFEERSYICNKNCPYYKTGKLCQRYDTICRRVYSLGFNAAQMEAEAEGIKDE